VKHPHECRLSDSRRHQLSAIAPGRCTCPALVDIYASAMPVGLNGIRSRNELVGMMVPQLITAHNAAMDCFRHAAILDQHAEARRENLAHAGKLSRTFATLLEALNRHRGKGKEDDG
jgi:hypothetical protein